MCHVSNLQKIFKNLSSRPSAKREWRDLVLLLLFLGSSFLSRSFLCSRLLSRSLALALSFRLSLLNLGLFLRKLRSSELLPAERNLCNPYRTVVLAMSLQLFV